MEVQQHGNYYKDLKTRQITGLDKKTYDSLKDSGYTSGMDIMKGLLSTTDYSIKTTGCNVVDCGDILRRRQEEKYNLVVAVWEQVGMTKIFHTEYTFYISPSDTQKLWGNMTYERLKEYDDYIKSIPAGKQAQQETKIRREALKTYTEDKNALFTINPKVDSKKQRRVQCSLKIKQLIKAGIEYKAITIRETVYSPPRNVTVC